MQFVDKVCKLKQTERNEDVFEAGSPKTLVVFGVSITSVGLQR